MRLLPCLLLLSCEILQWQDDDDVDHSASLFNCGISLSRGVLSQESLGLEHNDYESYIY